MPIAEISNKKVKVAGRWIDTDIKVLRITKHYQKFSKSLTFNKLEALQLLRELKELNLEELDE